MAKKKKGATRKKIPGEIRQQWFCQTCKTTTKQPVVPNKTLKTGLQLIHRRECEVCKTELTTIEIAENDILEIKSAVKKLDERLSQLFRD